jgi:hypothetical protein
MHRFPECKKHCINDDNGELYDICHVKLNKQDQLLYPCSDHTYEVELPNLLDGHSQKCNCFTCSCNKYMWDTHIDPAICNHIHIDTYGYTGGEQHPCIHGDITFVPFFVFHRGITQCDKRIHVAIYYYKKHVIINQCYRTSINRFCKVNINRLAKFVAFPELIKKSKMRTLSKNHDKDTGTTQSILRIGKDKDGVIWLYFFFNHDYWYNPQIYNIYDTRKYFVLKLEIKYIISDSLIKAILIKVITSLNLDKLLPSTNIICNYLI